MRYCNLLFSGIGFFVLFTCFVAFLLGHFTPCNFLVGILLLHITLNALFLFLDNVIENNQNCGNK